MFTVLINHKPTIMNRTRTHFHAVKPEIWQKTHKNRQYLKKNSLGIINAPLHKPTFSVYFIFLSKLFIRWILYVLVQLVHSCVSLDETNTILNARIPEIKKNTVYKNNAFSNSNNRSSCEINNRTTYDAASASHVMITRF